MTITCISGAFLAMLHLKGGPRTAHVERWFRVITDAYVRGGTKRLSFGTRSSQTGRRTIPRDQFFGRERERD
jgi:hypothetical protein